MILSPASSRRRNFKVILIFLSDTVWLPAVPAILQSIGFSIKIFRPRFFLLPRVPYIDFILISRRIDDIKANVRREIYFRKKQTSAASNLYNIGIFLRREARTINLFLSKSYQSLIITSNGSKALRSHLDLPRWFK